jgi:hypothetical protein
VKVRITAVGRVPVVVRVILRLLTGVVVGVSACAVVGDLVRRLVLMVVAHSSTS